MLKEPATFSTWLVARLVMVQSISLGPGPTPLLELAAAEATSGFWNLGVEVEKLWTFGTTMKQWGGAWIVRFWVGKHHLFLGWISSRSWEVLPLMRPKTVGFWYLSYHVFFPEDMSEGETFFFMYHMWIQWKSIPWNYPPHSNSHHQDYSIISS